MIRLRVVKTGVDNIDFIYTPTNGTISHNKSRKPGDKSIVLMFLYSLVLKTLYSVIKRRIFCFQDVKITIAIFKIIDR